MHNVPLKYVLAGIFLVLTLSSAGYYFYSRKPAAEATPSVPTGGTTETVATSTPQANPQVGLNLKDKTTLGVQWQNLPAGTNSINIYRSPKNKNTWIRWQAISVFQNTNRGIVTLTNGAADIPIGQNEDLSSYSYYSQAISGSGDALFTSGIGQTAPPSSGQSSPSNLGGSGSSSSSTPIIGGFNLIMAVNTSTNQTPSDPFNQSGMGSSSTPPQLPANPAPTGTPPVNPNPPTPAATSTTPTTIPTGTVSVAVQGMYYSPDGTPTGSGTQEAKFWVLRVNENIELGWQNLSIHTARLVIYRSPGANGPWTKLLEQKNPVPIIAAPHFMRLVDNTLDAPFYYKMEIFTIEGNILTTYGPVLLPVE